jgi:hypothetical protein
MIYALWQIKNGDTVRLPHHHPAVVLVEDIPTYSARTAEDLDYIQFSWHAPKEPAEGITSMTPRARVQLLHRPDKNWN